jgi:hypothetical protein
MDYMFLWRCLEWMDGFYSPRHRTGAWDYDRRTREIQQSCACCGLRAPLWAVGGPRTPGPIPGPQHQRTAVPAPAFFPNPSVPVRWLIHLPASQGPSEETPNPWGRGGAIAAKMLKVAMNKAPGWPAPSSSPSHVFSVTCLLRPHVFSAHPLAARPASVAAAAAVAAAHHGGGGGGGGGGGAPRRWRRRPRGRRRTAAVAAAAEGAAVAAADAGAAAVAAVDAGAAAVAAADAGAAVAAVDAGAGPEM